MSKYARQPVSDVIVRLQLTIPSVAYAVHEEPGHGPRMRHVVYGYVPPTQHEIDRLAQFLQVAPSELFTDEMLARANAVEVPSK